MGSTITNVPINNQAAAGESQDSESRSRSGGALTCPKCAKQTLYRVKRKGLLQRFLYARLGYYPWKCKDCKAVQLYKARGVRRRSSSAG